jgi:hypothetical protein
MTVLVRLTTVSILPRPVPQLVSAGEYSFPEGFDPAARSLVEALLAQAPEARLGAHDLSELRAHPFFEGVDWQRVRDAPAPPTVDARAPDTAAMGLDWELTSMALDSTNGMPSYEYLPPGTAV